MLAQSYLSEAVAREAQGAREAAEAVQAQLASVQRAIDVARNGVREAKVTYGAKQQMVAQLQEDWSQQSARRTATLPSAPSQPGKV